jgi:hypothetical protein
VALSDERLREIVSNLARRPGHEPVRSDIRDLLINHLGVPAGEIELEASLAEVRGRIDALVARTVFEFKSDLRRERDDAVAQLERYLKDREKATGRRFIGIATDGAEFSLYELRREKLVRLRNEFSVSTELRRHRNNSAETGHALAGWLSPLLNQRPELRPEPAFVRNELGRESIVYEIARGRLESMWEEVRADSEVVVKRELWAERLSLVYGTHVENDELFIQHTYLTLVAKTMATLMLGVETPPASDLLAGKPFQEAGIEGVVESDFFDWVLTAAEGGTVVNQISAQVARFRLGDITHDVLKVLYESLIDPEQRHDLGEYYTPDWLAQWVCERAIERPLEQRVLDPSCGSGTFLFHAVQGFLDAADAVAMPPQQSLSRCTELIFGIDVHPVAVINPRVTYLLAIGEARLKEHPRISIPVYLGDSMQWEAERVIGAADVVVRVPPHGEEGKRGQERPPHLTFPRAVAESPHLFDGVIREMIRLSERGAAVEEWEATITREFSTQLAQRTEDLKGTISVLARTYRNLRRLRQERRDHIWGYVARNLVRPVWLANAAQKVDVIVGNPPWLAQRNMSSEMQKRFREECKARGLWAGGKVATHQDLSVYFFARCVELYLRENSVIAFVMPFATMSRQAYSGFRTGNFGQHGAVRFVAAWTFDDSVKQLFNVPSCAIFAVEGAAAGLPKRVTAYAGEFPRRDSSIKEAAEYLTSRSTSWPKIREDAATTYGARFRQGATVVPRFLFVVNRVAAGRFGADSDRPMVESRRSNLQKKPWRELPQLTGAVEKKFLYPLLLGESVAPFRLLQSVEAIIPWDAKAKRLLDAQAALRDGQSSLAEWIGKAEALWKKYGRKRMTLSERLDKFHALATQMPPAPLRVVYSASGTMPAACILSDSKAVAEHALYWTSPDMESSAKFLAAVLNSEALRRRIESLQARGQWGARHFDKLLAEAIPEFDQSNKVHRELAELSERAEQIAAAVTLPEKIYFVRARKMIRDALRGDGVAARIDKLVEKLFQA